MMCPSDTQFAPQEEVSVNDAETELQWTAGCGMPFRRRLGNARMRYQVCETRGMLHFL